MLFRRQITSDLQLKETLLGRDATGAVKLNALQVLDNSIRQYAHLVTYQRDLKMLGEIACQLAVLNERAALEGVRLENRIAGHATMLLDLEQRVYRLMEPK